MVNKDSGKVLMKYPWILSPSIQENYSRIVSLLESESVKLDHCYVKLSIYHCCPHDWF